MKNGTLSLQAMDRFLKKTGAKRISEGAKEALRQYLEGEAEKVCSNARRNSLHAGRRTVNEADIKLAVRN